MGARCALLWTTATPYRIGDAVPANPLNTDDFGGELYNLGMSEAARPLLDQVKAFIADEVDPITEEFFRLGEEREERWSYAPGQLELLDGAKAKAKANGLWNFFLPDAETGQGLNNLDYAYIAGELGRNPLASECLNCSAPDTGNMEVLERVGTPEQKKEWLEPLLNGEIRSCFGMTEPGLASSDARNIATQAVLDGDEWVINGEKFYISGAGDPRCKIMICMVRTNPDAAPHLQQSQILVPMDTPGLEILGPMHVFGDDDAAGRSGSGQRAVDVDAAGADADGRGAAAAGPPADGVHRRARPHGRDWCGTQRPRAPSVQLDCLDVLRRPQHWYGGRHRPDEDALFPHHRRGRECRESRRPGSKR